MKIKAFGVITLLVFLDQLCKFFVRFWSLPYTLNRGISFGFFANASPIILIVTIIICLLVLLRWLWKHQDESTVVFWYIALWLAGGIGNLIDRLFYGATFDFIYFGLFPVFNLADVMISLGFVLFAIKLIYERTGKNL